jgi:hypothetical protein
MFPPKLIRKVFFISKFPQKIMIPKINFFKFENLTLKNSKFQGVFPPITIFQAKMKILNFFIVLKCSHQKIFRKVIFFNFKIPVKKD